MAALDQCPALPGVWIGDIEELPLSPPRGRGEESATELIERGFLDVLRADPCTYCGGLGGILDHIQPRSLGGLDGWENFASVCFSCNSVKGPRSVLSTLWLRQDLPLLEAHKQRRRDWARVGK